LSYDPSELAAVLSSLQGVIDKLKEVVETFRNNHTASAQVPITGLIGYWTFDEGNGTTALDSSGNNNNGTLLNSPTWVTGKVGDALQFDGINDWVSIGNPTTLNNKGPYSISAWIKPSALDGYIVAKRTNEQTGYWRLGTGLDNKLGWFKDTSESTHVSAASKAGILTLNTWQHVALTWDGTLSGTEAKIYLNGVEVDYSIRQNGTGKILSDSLNNFAIGSRNGGSAFFSGSIDEVKFYNRVLNASEVSALYSSTPTPTPTPTPISTFCVSCAPPPVGCSYTGGTCQSCGTLSCTTPTPTPIVAVA
jgi:hypothetical protein